MAIWQVSAGESGRRYPERFLNDRVAFIGPGDPGPWAPELPDEKFGGGYVRRFAGEMQHEDLLVLRQGRDTILAVGRVIGEYQYCKQFDEVLGWDLQHCRRVCWVELKGPHIFDQPVFGASPSRFSQVHNQVVIDFISQFVDQDECLSNYCEQYDLPDLPEIEPVLPIADLQGNLQNLQIPIQEITDLMELYYGGNLGDDYLSEHESTAHFVVPLLRALGWAMPNVAVEWRRIDIAVFTDTPRAPQNCRFVIEVKRPDTGILRALENAFHYANEYEIMGDDRYIVITDGILYLMYKANAENLGNFDNLDNINPIAYANIYRLKESHLKLFNLLCQQPEN